MDPAILDQLRQRQLGRLAADIIEGTDDDHAGRVVHDDIDTGSLLERADIATLAADDATLHVVARNIHGADGRIRGMAGCIALDTGGENLTGLFLDGRTQVLFGFLNALRDLDGEFLLESFE